MAQSMIEAVYLKNGEVVKGDIIEQVPGQSLKIMTKDGDVFVFYMDEVELITKEKKTRSQPSDHPGLDLSADAGYDIITKEGGGGYVAVDLELGKRFNKNFYWGFIGSGVHFPTFDGAKPNIPLTTHFKAFFPMSTSSVVPFVGLKAGYHFNTGGGQGSVRLQLTPGVQFPLSGNVDFNLGAGYAYLIPTAGGDGMGVVVIRAGFGFHPSSEAKPLLESYADVLQLTVEGGASGGAFFRYSGGNIVFSYKLKNTLMFGIGVGYNTFECDDKRNSLHPEFDGNFFRTFVRGQYRLNDRRISPFVSCDLGLRFLSDAGIFSEIGDCSKTRPFVAPAIGLSVRPSRNTYLDLKLGYDMSSNLSAKIYNVEIETPSQSCMFFQLGFTRTFEKLKLGF